MDKLQIYEIIVKSIENYLCEMGGGKINIDKNTPLIGNAKLLDSMGLVNVLVDIETAFLDEDIEISLTSEMAMSCRISPFRSVGSLCNFIARQLGVEEMQ